VRFIVTSVERTASDDSQITNTSLAEFDTYLLLYLSYIRLPTKRVFFPVSVAAMGQVRCATSRLRLGGLGEGEANERTRNIDL